MSEFNFFRKNSQKTANDGETTTTLDISKEDVIVDRNLFVKEDGNQTDQIDNKTISFQQKIFNYLNSDFESKGYHDALTNPDSKYKNDNIKILEYDLIILIEEAELAYQEYLTDIEFHISSRRKSGLDDLVEEVESRKDLITNKIAFIEKLKQQIDTKSGPPQRILLGYQRGFIRGLAALTSANIINKNI